MNWLIFFITYAVIGSFIYGCSLTFLDGEIDPKRFTAWAVCWPFILCCLLGMFMAAGGLSIVATFAARMKR